MMGRAACIAIAATRGKNPTLKARAKLQKAAAKLAGATGDVLAVWATDSRGDEINGHRAALELTAGREVTLHTANGSVSVKL